MGCSKDDGLWHFVLWEHSVRLITIMSEHSVAVAVKAGHSDVCAPRAYSLRQQGTGIENLPWKTQKHRERQLIEEKTG